MKLTHLELHNFRNYESLNLEFKNKITVVEGENGSGKTNLAEAVYYLSLAKSWRTNEHSALIRHGEKHALIKARVEESGLNRGIEISIIPKGRKICINGKPARRLSELSKLV
ncbi:MAG: AAA family ATPase, partial [Enterococcus sp.]|nr:AAA family ATPase [Enterococcus sp.]